MDPVLADGRVRTALCLGFGQFSGQWNALPFAEDRCESLIKALNRFGYQCERVGAGLVAQHLGEVVTRAIENAGPTDLLVIHVLSHGALSNTGALRIVGSDGKHHGITEVERWIKSVVDDDGPTTLFLLDVCGAGIAARFDWQSLITSPSGARAWIIGACAPDEVAFEGRFTTAISTVLNELADGTLDIDPSYRYAPLPTLAQRIRRQVIHLADARNALVQQVTGSLVDISADPPELPFFPNERYRSDPRRMVRLQLEPALAPFLDDIDEALDPTFFVDRASGSAGLAGCFSGRKAELKTLVPWLDLRDDVGLRVVTGSPGVGKSALIGVLVCAAHPLLREPTHAIWEHVDPSPWVNKRLAAVHARGRSLSQIVASLGRQLNVALPEGNEATARLIEAIAAMRDDPVLIVDALDEAVDGVAVMEQLLIPLAKTTHPNGESVRLLVGMRPWKEFSALLELAGGEGLTDLDLVPSDRLRRDLQQYVSQLLISDERWDQLDVEGKAHTLARAVAETLTDGLHDRKWGAFLVAGLFANHVLHSYSEPPADVVRLGKSVPLTLPKLLDLDLGSRTEGARLRQVLSVLAHAFGDGMPADTVRNIAAGLMGDPELSTQDIIAALDATKFYLRHSAGPDGITSYRLFHQGLADHLKSLVSSADVYQGLLSSVIVSDGEVAKMHWALAEPYLLRYAAAHAVEAGQVQVLIRNVGFLLYADPSALEFAAAQQDLPRRAMALGTIIKGLAPEDLMSDAEQRRQAFMREVASREDASLEDRILLDALKRVPGMGRLQWVPLWRHKTPTSAVSTATVFSREGRPSVVLGFDNGDLRILDIDDGSRRVEINGAHRSRVTAIDVGESGRATALVSGDSAGLLCVHHAASGALLMAPTAVGSAVEYLSIGETGGQPSALVVRSGELPGIWDLTNALHIGQLTSAPVAYGQSAGECQLWLASPASGLPSASFVTDESGESIATRPDSYSLAIGAVNGIPVLYEGGPDGKMSITEARSSRTLAEFEVRVPILGLRATGNGTVIVWTDRDVQAIQYAGFGNETSDRPVETRAGLVTWTLPPSKRAKELQAVAADVIVPPLALDSARVPSAVREAAEELLRKCPQIMELLIVGRDGLPRAVFTGIPQENIERLSALVSGLLGGIDSVAKLLAKARAYQCTVRVPGGVLRVLPIQQDLAIVAFSHGDEDPGATGYEIAIAANKIVAVKPWAESPAGER